jgi:phage repressor protein C with HTH and peptisase S24 domain
MSVENIIRDMIRDGGYKNQKALSLGIGISESFISKWKRDDHIPDEYLSKFNVLPQNNNLITVPLVSAIAGMADNGREFFEVETKTQLMIDKMMFKILPNIKNIQAIQCEGDSMLPTLREDDIVIIEMGDRFSGDGIYALHWDGVILVKRLQTGNDEGIIDVISDNQSYKVKTFDRYNNQSAFHIIGKVILRIQK